MAVAAAAVVLLEAGQATQTGPGPLAAGPAAALAAQSFLHCCRLNRYSQEPGAGQCAVCHLRCRTPLRAAAAVGEVAAPSSPGPCSKRYSFPSQALQCRPQSKGTLRDAGQGSAAQVVGACPLRLPQSVAPHILQLCRDRHVALCRCQISGLRTV